MSHSQPVQKWSLTVFFPKSLRLPHLESLNARNPNMSNPQPASPTHQVHLPSPPHPEAPPPTPPSPDDEANYKCTCGAPDTSKDWIRCDSDTCPVGWYHWHCVLVTEAPSGKWFCPNCRPTPRPSSSSKKAQTPKKQRRSRASMLSRTPGKMALATAAGGKRIDSSKHQDDKEEEKSQDKPTRPAKKGIAIKKSTPKKKATWKWVEVAEQDEKHNHKHTGDAAVQRSDAIAKQRRRTMRSMVRATQLSHKGKEAEEVAWEELR